MPTQLFGALQRLRAQLPAATPDTAIAELAPHIGHPLVAELARLLRAQSQASNRLFALSTGPGAQIAAGFLHTREYPKAGFECFDYAAIDTPAKFREGIPDNAAKPVDMLAHTEGMSHGRFVALFPEHFRGKTPEPGDKAFYFINKFIRRTRSVTLPLVKMFWDTGPFQALLNAPDSTLSRAMTGWVTMHEGFHQTGHMPAPEGLSYKSTRSAAAFEELRVDLLVLRHAADRMASDPEFRLMFELVLAERLLRYGAEYDPQTTFDPRTSLGFYAGLEAAGAVSVDATTGQQSLDLEACLAWVRDQCQRMEALEARIKGYAARDIRVLLRVHMEQLARQDVPWTRPAYFDAASRYLQDSRVLDFA